LPVLAGRLAADPIVIVDDTMRDDEREMLRLWAEEFPRFAQHPIPCEKGCVRLSARIG
jgi:hypothetical protein